MRRASTHSPARSHSHARARAEQRHRRKPERTRIKGTRCHCHWIWDGRSHMCCDVGEGRKARACAGAALRCRCIRNCPLCCFTMCCEHACTLALDQSLRALHTQPRGMTPAPSCHTLELTHLHTRTPPCSHAGGCTHTFEHRCDSVSSPAESGNKHVACSRTTRALRLLPHSLLAHLARAACVVFI